MAFRGFRCWVLAWIVEPEPVFEISAREWSKLFVAQIGDSDVEPAMSQTSDEEFAFCERSDRFMDVFLGRDLQQATIRLVLFGVIIAAIVVSISGMAA